MAARRQDNQAKPRQRHAPAAYATWAQLVLLLLICSLPLLTELGTRNPKHWMEGAALMTSQETWFNQHAGDPQAWLNPTINGSPRINKPPLVIWLNMLAWSDLTPETSTAAQLMHRARLVTAAMGLLLTAAVFWMGCTLRGPRLGMIAAMIAATTPLFLQTQARMASYDIHLVAWATLASAAALWAMQPFAATFSGRRAVIGWTICGLAAGLSWMSKNPLGLVMVGLLAVTAAVLDRRRILSLAACLPLALAACLLVVAPWYIHQYLRDPDAVKAILTREYSGRDSNPHGPFFYVILLRLALPWTMWVIGGLVHPFVAEQRGRRGPRLLPWLWFVLILVAFSIHAGKAPRYILPILPALALMAGQVFDDHQARADRRLTTPGVRLLLVPHWLGIIVVSALFVPLLASSQPSVGIEWLDSLTMASITPATAVVLTAILISLAAVGAWRHLANRPLQAAIFTAVWTIVLSSVYWHCYANAPNSTDEFRAAAERVRELAGDRPLRCLRTTAPERVDLEFLFFYRGTIPTVKPDRLGRFVASSGGPVFVMADPLPANDAALEEAGFRVIFEFQDEADHDRRLWRRDAADPSGPVRPEP
ncbi:MAG: glycosyltransferase family 39 protein [Phycisphaerales bacterium]|nr:MAG: glycosyltransferase family 39 protein [Phycisphaerales bacterium]